jgi:hypothetical protein
MFHGGTTMPDPKVLGQTLRYFPRIAAIIELNASCRAACDGDLSPESGKRRGLNRNRRRCGPRPAHGSDVKFPILRKASRILSRGSPMGAAFSLNLLFLRADVLTITASISSPVIVPALD